MNCKMASWQRKMEHVEVIEFVLCHVCPFFPSPFSKNVLFLSLCAKGERYAIWLTKLNWVAQPPLTIRFQQLFVSVVRFIRLRNWCSFQESLGTHRGIVAAGLWCCCLKLTARWGIAASRSRCGAIEKIFMDIDIDFYAEESTTSQRQFWDEKSKRVVQLIWNKSVQRSKGQRPEGARSHTAVFEPTHRIRMRQLESRPCVVPCNLAAN